MFVRRCCIRRFLFLACSIVFLFAAAALADPSPAGGDSKQLKPAPNAAKHFPAPATSDAPAPSKKNGAAAEASPVPDRSPEGVSPTQSRSWDAARGQSRANANPSTAEYVHNVELGMIVPLWSVVPFLGLLASLVLVSAISRDFWRRHYLKFAGFWTLALVVPFTFAFGGLAWREIVSIVLLYYLPFIIFLWSLYAVAGGLIVRGAWRGRPWSNALWLLIGAAAAGVIGTAGAALLFIGPFLRANAHRRRKTHLVVFFMILVGNIGGGASPLGSAPLLVGYLTGVPFLWSLALLPQILLATGLRLAVFLVIDWRLAARESAEPAPADPVRVRGWMHLIFFAGIVAALILPGWLALGSTTIAGVRLAHSGLLRDALILLMGGLSALSTSRAQRAERGFTWEPMKRTASLFAAIFVTIVPALAILRAGEDGALGALMTRIREPWHYFALAGGLAALLNNVPAYLALLTSQLSVFYPALEQGEALTRLLADHKLDLVAVSAGSTILGALTYIGNAPTYIIHGIAEESGVKMPSFLRYLFVWTAPILLPIFALLTWVFYVRA